MTRILYVGQFSFVKGPHVLAQVFSKLAKRHANLDLTWVGSEQHHNAARNLLDPTVAHRVNFENWRDQAALVGLFDQHGIFVFPSHYEGAGKASLEAMARGLCVVASNVGAMRDYISNEENGLLVPPGDVDGFADAITKLIENPDSGARISRNARTTAAEKSWAECATGLTLFYRALRHPDTTDEVENSTAIPATMH